MLGAARRQKDTVHFIYSLPTTYAGVTHNTSSFGGVKHHVWANLNQVAFQTVMIVWGHINKELFAGPCQSKSRHHSAGVPKTIG